MAIKNKKSDSIPSKFTKKSKNLSAIDSLKNFKLGIKSVLNQQNISSLGLPKIDPIKEKNEDPESKELELLKGENSSDNEDK